MNGFTRQKGRACAAFVAALAFTVGSRPAEARGLLSPIANTRVQVTNEEVATTFGADATTSWTRLETSAGGFVWLIPLPYGARADVGSDAWFAALDVSAAARVIPPPTAAPCNALGSAEIESTLAHGTRIAPSDARVLFADPDVLTFGPDLELSDETIAAAHDVFASGSALLALRFDAAEGIVHTPTIRVTWPSAASGSIATTIGAGVHPSLSTMYAIGPGPAAFGGAPVILGATAPLEITWGARGSDYPAVRFDALVGAGEGHFLVESASHSGLFVARPDQALSIPSVAASYFGPDGCAFEGEGLSSSSARVSTTCAAGALAWFGAASCDETVLAGETDAHTLRCGGDDFALALSHTTPTVLSVTRALTTGDTSAPVVLGGMEQSTVVASTEYDLGCRTASKSSGSVGNAGGANVSASGSGGSSDNENGGTLDTTTDVGVAPDTSGDSCSGDSNDSGGDDCSGDSGSSGDDSGCSGDSGGGGGDACSGGGAGAGGGADGCGGGGGGGDCSTARHGHQKKSPFSRVALGAIGLLFMWRRRSRVR